MALEELYAPFEGSPIALKFESISEQEWRNASSAHDPVCGPAEAAGTPAFWSSRYIGGPDGISMQHYWDELKSFQV